MNEKGNTKRRKYRGSEFLDDLYDELDEAPMKGQKKRRLNKNDMPKIKIENKQRREEEN